MAEAGNKDQQSYLTDSAIVTAWFATRTVDTTVCALLLARTARNRARGSTANQKN